MPRWRKFSLAKAELKRMLAAWSKSGSSVTKHRIDEINTIIAACQVALRNLARKNMDSRGRSLRRRSQIPAEMSALLRSATKFLPKVWVSPYEGAESLAESRARAWRGTTDTKVDLLSGTRCKLVRRSRYLHKNSGFRELVGNMAIYATGDGVKPQAVSPNPTWNKADERHSEPWTTGCESAKHYCLAQCQVVRIAQ